MNIVNIFVCESNHTSEILKEKCLPRIHDTWMSMYMVYAKLTFNENRYLYFSLSYVKWQAGTCSMGEVWLQTLMSFKISSTDEVYIYVSIM